MILNDFNDTIQDESIEKISVNVNNLTFNLMIDGIYTNKLHSVIRELATNGRDSIIEAKKGKLIITVSSTPVGIKVSIKDTGLGLSEEDARKYLCTLNASSKRNSNDAVGCLGIGSKSAFSLVSHYRYTCVKDSVETFVELFRVEKESPRFVVTTQNTDKEDSVECVLDIPLNVITIDPEKALEAVLVAIVSELCLFDIPIELFIDSQNFDKNLDYFSRLFPKVSIKDSFYILDFSNKNYSEIIETFTNVKYEACEYVKNNKQVACGVVSYKSDFRPIRDERLKAIIIKTELGNLTFDSSRENIENTIANSRILSEIIQNFKNNYLAQIQLLEAFICFAADHLPADSDTLPFINNTIDLDACLNICFNVIKQYLENEDYRDLVSILYCYCTSNSRENQLQKYILIKYNSVHVLKQLEAFYLTYSSEEAYLNENSFTLIVKILSTILRRSGLYSYSKSCSVEGKCKANTEENKIIFITTNENITSLSHTLSSLNEEDKTLIFHHYMKKEGFDHDDVQSCITKLVDFLISLGFSTIHFNKLKEMNQKEGYSKYYEKIKPVSIRNSRVISSTNSTITVGEQTLETSSDGLILRVNFDLVYYKNGTTSTLENTTSIKAYNFVKSLLNREYSSILLYIPSTIISTDEDREEFLKLFSKAFIIFEYQNNIENYILEPLLKALKRVPDIYVNLGDHLELTEEELNTFKECYSFFKYKYFLEEKITEYVNLVDTQRSTVSYKSLYSSPLSSLKNFYEIKKAVSLWYPSLKNHYLGNSCSFIFYKYFLNKVYTQEELEELHEELKNTVPSYDFQKHFNIVKGFL